MKRERKESTVKLPQRALRAIAVLPDDFCGSLSLHVNGRGVYTVEIRHQQRFTANDDQLVDFTELPLRDSLERNTRPRR
jgi:hypothetical protein